MPDFPRYSSKGQVSTQQPSVLAPEDRTGEVVAQAGQKIGSDIQQNAIKWGNAVDTIQKTRATANFKSGMADIQARAAADPDYNNSEAYFKEIEKLRTDNLKGFSSRLAETEAAIEFDYEAKIGRIQVENLYRKKMIDVGQTASLQLIDSEVNNPTENSFSNIKEELGRQVKAGIFDRKDAYQLERKANDDLGVNRINKDLYQAEDLERLDEVISGITTGSYEQGGVVIPPDKKKNLLDVAESARKNLEKKIQAQQVDDMARNRVDVISGIASGEVDPKTLDIAEIAEYDPQLGAALTKVKDFMVNYNPKTTKEEQRVSMAGVVPVNELKKARSYAKSVNDVFMMKDNEQLGDFVLREIQKKGDGTTPSVKLAAFMQLAALKVKANSPSSPQDFKAADMLSNIKRGFKYLQASNPYLSTLAVADYLVRVFADGGVTNREEAVNAAKTVLEEKVLDRYKATSKLDSMPNKIVDGDTTVDEIHSGLNELEGEAFSGDYGDQNERE